MSEFTVSAKLIADASGMKQGLAEGKAAIQTMTAEQFRAAGGAEGLAAADRKAAAAARDAAKATREKTLADRAALSATRQHSTGIRQVGMAFNDVATQISMGQKPMQVFVTQAGQVGYAMSLMKGRLGALGVALAGPIGAIGILGGALLGGLISRLWDASKATDGLTEAQKIQRMGLEELSKAIREADADMKKSIQTTNDAKMAAYDDARMRAARVVQLRNEARAALELAIANARLAESAAATLGGEEGKFARQAAGFVASRVPALEAQLRRAEAELRNAEEAHRRAALPVLRSQSDARTDRGTAIKKAFEDRERELGERLVANTITLREHNRELDKARQIRERDTDALRESNRASRRPGDPSMPKVRPADAASLLREVFGGGTVTSTTGGKHAPNSYHYAAQAVDFVPKGGIGSLGASWREDIRAAAAAVGIKVLELLGPGDRGHDRHLHLAFAKQRMGPDQVATAAARDADRMAREAEQRQRAAEQLATFGTNAGQTIAGVMGRFGDAPRLAEQARATLSELDQLLAEIEKRKPPNFEALLQQGREAKEVVQEGVYQPYRDFLDDQQFQIEQQRLIIAGREEEAEVQDVIRQLSRDQGTLEAWQVAEIRQRIALLRAEAREAEIVFEKQQIYLDAVQSTKEAVRGIFDFSGKGLQELPKRLFATFEKLAGDLLFEKMFGKFFRQLEDQIKGSGPLEVFDQKVDTANTSLGDFDKALKSVTTTLGGTGGSTPSAGSFAAAMAETIRTLPGGPGSSTGGNNGTDIIVTANRNVKVAVPGLDDKLGSILKNMGGAAVGLAANFIQQAFGGVGQMGGNVSGGKLSDTLGGLAQTAAQFVPQLGIGMAVTSGLSKILGVKNFAGGAFGIVGNLIASALGFGKAKKGSATITSATGAPSYSGSGKFKAGAVGAAGGIQDTLRSIADQLGGGLGDFAVSIGMRKDKFVVDPTGKGRTKGRNTPSFKDEAAAISFAIMDAIKDGAVTGLSAAVQKALRSSSDLDRALREAMKVQEVEMLLGGLSAQFGKIFRDFERQAAERVRIARAYGFDILKIEELNAKERAKLLEDTLASRVGSLKSLLDDLNFGDLFEGTVLDRMAKLRTELDKATADAAAGVEGAADKQAQLSRDLVGLSRESYGTAGGEFAADLAAARSGAERTIQLESERLKAAADAALQTNTHLNENNNQNAELIAGQTRTNTLLEQLVASGGGGGGGGGIGSYDTGRRTVLH